jgi:hypothetical protein
MALVLIALTAPIVIAACSGASAEPTHPGKTAAAGKNGPARRVPEAGASDTGARGARERDGGPPDGAPPEGGAAKLTPTSNEKGPEPPTHGPEPASCPSDMALVDGEYCTELELKCLRSTYAPQNKKVICHEFESPSKCVGDKVKRRYCIDKYEYPNKKGERPLVNMNFPEAQRMCAAQGKRVCTETEWTMACEGPSYKPYPYGYVRDPTKCRGDRPYRFPNVKKTFSKDKAEARAELERLWDGVTSGSQPECVSDYGVFDMPGNADELASSETPAPRSEFDNVTTGGPWLDGVRNQCRPKIYTHNEGFAYYYLSFRCCAEPDGSPTDPRSPKQIKRREKWKG